MKAPPHLNMPFATFAIPYHFFGPCNGLLKNGLCFLDHDWCQSSTYFCGMLTTLGHGMAPTRPYKRCQQCQNFTRHNRNQNGGYGGKIISLIFDICNNMSIKLGFCNHIIHCKAMAFPNLSIVSKWFYYQRQKKILPRVGPNLFCQMSLYFRPFSFSCNQLHPKLLIIAFQMFIKRKDVLCKTIVYHTFFFVLQMEYLNNK
jgi:hypothetical protein